MTPELDSARIAVALGNQTRVKLLEALKGGEEKSPAMLSIELNEPIGNCSYHLKVLGRLGAVEETRNQPVRGAVEHFYRSTGTLSVMSDANLALDAIAEVVRKAVETDVAVEEIRDILAESGRKAEFVR